MSTAITAQVGDLVEFLDARREEIRGYCLSIHGYRDSSEEIEVQTYAHTQADGQATADALGLTFTQDQNWPYTYNARVNGVAYTFVLDTRDTSKYPATFAPEGN